MLVSLNKKTKQITLCSFLRDSYLYVEGKNKQAFTKLNAAFSMGENADCLIQTIEHNYKIKIDNYAMVNFESFERIVDAMGGINVQVTQQDSNNCYKKFGESLPVGDNVKLNGRQTVYFCRDRNYTDGDVTRTSKQRKVIEAIIDKVKGASLTDLDSYLDLLLPEIYTGYSDSEIISLGMEALTGGWAKYSRKQITVPETDCRQAGSANMWIWVVDYQKAAHDLQMALYGKSNITLEADRKTFIDLYNEGLTEDNSGNGGNNGGSTDVPETEGVTVPSTDISETLPGEDVSMEEIPSDIPSDIPSNEVTGDTVPNTGTGNEGSGGEVTDIPVDTPTEGGDQPTEGTSADEDLVSGGDE
jgi:LCP family protein required for cell wall assembly